jgi:uncharacterized membrane protein
VTSEAQTKKITTLSFLLVFVALLGLLDSTYLSFSTLGGTSLVCGEFGDCDGVVSSQYSKIFGISVAYLGFLYYATFFFLSLTLATFKKSGLIFPLFLLSLVGIGASAWFVFAQLVLLQSVCVYCMVSAGTSATLFLITLVMWGTHRKNRKNSVHSPAPTDSRESEPV